MTDWWKQERHRRRWPLRSLQERYPASIQDRLGITGTEWARARDHGLTDRQADRWSIKLGLHPACVWPDWLDAGLTPLDDIFVNGCDDALPGWRPAFEWAEIRGCSPVVPPAERATVAA